MRLGLQIWHMPDRNGCWAIAVLLLPLARRKLGGHRFDLLLL